MCKLRFANVEINFGSLKADLAMTEDEYARNRKIWFEGQWDLNSSPPPQPVSPDDYTKFDSPGNFGPSEPKTIVLMVGIKAGMRERIARRFADQIRGLLIADPVIGAQTRTEVNEDDEQEATDRLHEQLAKGFDPRNLFAAGGLV